MNDENLSLFVRNREKILYQGEATSISSYNTKGKFDVLLYHANFITLIEKKLIYRDRTGEEHEISVTNGIMRVQKNQVRVYLGIGI